jgi:hypothetical protein
MTLLTLSALMLIPKMIHVTLSEYPYSAVQVSLINHVIGTKNNVITTKSTIM